MSEARKTTCPGGEIHTNINKLPSSIRMRVAAHKYAAAVNMYATTDLTIEHVAERCGVTASGLSAHLSKYHRDLLFIRYGLDINDENLKSQKIKPSKGQSQKAHLKYKEAIEACGDMAYIEFNVSQIARMFNLKGTLLTFQLKVHYPDVLPTREKLRQRLGIADNTHRGPRHRCSNAYKPALELYRDSDLTIAEVARRCNVSEGGLSQFLRFYHQDIIALKSARRNAARKKLGYRIPGKPTATGGIYGPKAETVALYAPAMEMYRDTNLTLNEIATQTGVTASGLKGYIHQWHRATKRCRNGHKSTALKYAPAIASLKENPRSVAKVAADFGLNPDLFRSYLKTHEPELAAQRGMMRRTDGKLVKCSSSKRYARAIREYATTAEPLKSIARRHGIVYNSLMGYVTRNCPEERESHQRLVDNQHQTLRCTTHS